MPPTILSLHFHEAVPFSSLWVDMNDQEIEYLILFVIEIGAGMAMTQAYLVIAFYSGNAGENEAFVFFYNIY